MRRVPSKVPMRRPLANSIGSGSTRATLISSHAAVAERLLHDDIECAAPALEENWLNGKERVLAAFARRGTVPLNS